MCVVCVCVFIGIRVSGAIIDELGLRSDANFFGAIAKWLGLLVCISLYVHVFIFMITIPMIVSLLLLFLVLAVIIRISYMRRIEKNDENAFSSHN